MNVTKKGLAKLIDSLEWFCDEGPHGEGWQSAELIELIDYLKKIHAAMEDYKP